MPCSSSETICGAVADLDFPTGTEEKETLVSLLSERGKKKEGGQCRWCSISKTLLEEKLAGAGSENGRVLPGPGAS